MSRGWGYPTSPFLGAGGTLTNLSQGAPYHVTYAMMHLMFHLPCEQTDACEIIAFSQMYLQVVIKFDQHEIKAVTKNK